MGDEKHLATWPAAARTGRAVAKIDRPRLAIAIDPLAHLYFKQTVGKLQ
jgi:hypothetical protein